MLTIIYNLFLGTVVDNFIMLLIFFFLPGLFATIDGLIILHPIVVKYINSFSLLNWTRFDYEFCGSVSWLVYS